MAEMEAVNAFNAELSSLYEVKPPISKGKMTSVTRAALKAVKLYKHVVQSVEKFIQKCKPEYKVPGLYVMDSIIRQSRHQFGIEKDVFAIRFARNLTLTFSHLYKCSEEDKPKIIRVLNLWQKNKIFTPEVIAPLFDLANPEHKIWTTLGQSGQESSQQTHNAPSSRPSAGELGQVSFRQDLLEYDYDDDEPRQGGENPPAASQQALADKIGSNVINSLDAFALLANPEVLRQLQTLQEQMTGPAQGQFSTPEQERQRKLAELNKQEAAFEQRLAQTVARLPFAVDCEFEQPIPDQQEDRNDLHMPMPQQAVQNVAQFIPPGLLQQIESSVQQMAHQQNQALGQQSLGNMFGQLQNLPPQDLFNQGLLNQFSQQNQAQPMFEEKFDGDEERRRRRSRSTDRDRRHRSRSRSPSRRRRSRSGSRGRTSSGRKRTYRSRSRERREDKEKEKERARKGFPPVKKEHLSVCSTTLWVGHLSKLVSQEELSDTFGIYGDIVSIDVISSRGCAFVVMNRRQDALRALERLRNTKLQGKSITLAWAPGKGVKGRDWKDYWEVDNGVSYIPWSKLRNDTDLEEFEEGGCVDEDTLPTHLKNRPKAPKAEGEASQDNESKPDLDLSATPVASLGVAGVPLMQGPNVGGPEAMKPSELKPDVLTSTGHPLTAAGVPVPLPVQVPTPGGGMVQQFMGLPHQMNMLGMPPNYGMMVPPPLMPGPGGPFPPPGNMLVQGMLGNHSAIMGGGPGGPVPPALLDLQLMQVVNPQLGHLETTANAGEGFPADLDSKRQMDDETRAPKTSDFGHRRKKSRFDDVQSSPTEDMRNIDMAEDRAPLQERLKQMAEYGQRENPNPRPSLLGNPGGGPIFNNGPQMPHGDRPRPGFIPPLFNNTPGPNMGMNRMPGPGNPNWFEMNAGGAGGRDNGNPFANQSPAPNPFAGNPFVQQPAAANPFDLNSNFEPTNPNFNNESPRATNWITNRDLQQQGSPQKWRGGRGGGPSPWGRNDRRDDGRFGGGDNWRDSPRGGHNRDLRGGEWGDRGRGRDRGRDSGNNHDRRDSHDRGGGREWRPPFENRRGGRGGDDFGRDRGRGGRFGGDRNNRFDRQEQGFNPNEGNQDSQEEHEPQSALNDNWELPQAPRMDSADNVEVADKSENSAGAPLLQSEVSEGDQQQHEPPQQNTDDIQPEGPSENEWKREQQVDESESFNENEDAHYSNDTDRHEQEAGDNTMKVESEYNSRPEPDNHVAESNNFTGNEEEPYHNDHVVSKSPTWTEPREEEKVPPVFNHRRTLCKAAVKQYDDDYPPAVVTDYSANDTCHDEEDNDSYSHDNGNSHEVDAANSVPPFERRASYDLADTNHKTEVNYENGNGGDYNNENSSDNVYVKPDLDRAQDPELSSNSNETNNIHSSILTQEEGTV